jgi:hypothetical protein
MTMTGTATAIEMNFEKDVVRLCARTTALLDEAHDTPALRAELASCAPSLIASKTAGGQVSKVIMHVRIGNPLWSLQLEDAIRRELRTHRSVHGPVHMEVQRYR